MTENSFLQNSLLLRSKFCKKSFLKEKARNVQICKGNFFAKGGGGMNSQNTILAENYIKYLLLQIKLIFASPSHTDMVGNSLKNLFIGNDTKCPVKFLCRLDISCNYRQQILCCSELTMGFCKIHLLSRCGYSMQFPAKKKSELTPTPAVYGSCQKSFFSTYLVNSFSFQW